MGLVDGAYRHPDAEAVERGFIEQEHPLEGRVLGEEFDREGLAGLGIDHLLVAHLVTRFLEQLDRFAQIVAQRFRSAVDRIGIGLLENVGRNFVAHGFEHFEFAAGRHAGRRKLGAFKIAGDTFVLAEENLFVHLLEVERIIEGEPYPRILEFGTANVESEGLHHADIADRKFFLSTRLSVTAGKS